MWFVDQRIPGGQIEIPMQLPVAILVAVCGLPLVISAMLAFRNVGTTIDPIHPEEASQLVVSGVFRYSRNPMYVSLSLILTGWGIWLGSVNNIAVLILFIYYITIFQIKPEEKVLTSLFGEEYEQYCAKVRRWI